MNISTGQEANTQSRNTPRKLILYSSFWINLLEITSKALDRSKKRPSSSFLYTKFTEENVAVWVNLPSLKSCWLTVIILKRIRNVIILIWMLEIQSNLRIFCYIEIINFLLDQHSYNMNCAYFLKAPRISHPKRVVWTLWHSLIHLSRRRVIDPSGPFWMEQRAR